MVSDCALLMSPWSRIPASLVVHVTVAKLPNRPLYIALPCIIIDTTQPTQLRQKISCENGSLHLSCIQNMDSNPTTKQKALHYRWGRIEPTVTTVPNLFHLGFVTARPEGCVELSHPNAEAPPMGFEDHCFPARASSGDAREDAGCEVVESPTGSGPEPVGVLAADCEVREEDLDGRNTFMARPRDGRPAAEDAGSTLESRFHEPQTPAGSVLAGLLSGISAGLAAGGCCCGCCGCCCCCCWCSRRGSLLGGCGVSGDCAC